MMDHALVQLGRAVGDSLQTLKLGGCGFYKMSHRMTDATLAILVEHFPLLSCVSIYSSGFETSNEALHRFLESHPLLQELGLQGRFGNKPQNVEYILQHAQSCTALRIFRASVCENAALRLFADMVQLYRWLDILQIEGFEHCRTASSLRLDTGDYEYPVDNSVADVVCNILTACSPVRKLSLSDSMGQQSIGQHMGEDVQELEYVGDCNKLSTLLVHCHKLHTLKVHMMVSASQTAINKLRQLGACCPGLRSLTITSDRYGPFAAVVEDAGVEVLFGTFPGLKHVDLNYELSPRTLQCILQNKMHLRTLTTTTEPYSNANAIVRKFRQLAKNRQQLPVTQFRETKLRSNNDVESLGCFIAHH